MEKESNRKIQTIVLHQLPQKPCEALPLGPTDTQLSVGLQLANFAIKTVWNRL